MARVSVDERSVQHCIHERIMGPDDRGIERVPESERERVLKKIKELTQCEQPPESLGGDGYGWQVVMRNDKGEVQFRIIVRGNVVRTILSQTERNPQLPVYKIKKGKDGTTPVLQKDLGG
jgi:hypothetical protein